MSVLLEVMGSIGDSWGSLSSVSVFWVSCCCGPMSALWSCCGSGVEVLGCMGVWVDLSVSS